MTDRRSRPDYLYDGEGPADPVVRDFERALSPYRARDIERHKPARGRWGFAAAAAVLLVVGGALAGTLTTGHDAGVCPEGAWTVSGAPGNRCLAVGDWLETDREGLALEVTNLGEVDVLPASKVRLVEASDDAQRIELRRGGISAVIAAPPRLFLVDTPSGTAVDLGCAYDLFVDADGGTTLEVTAGEVAIARGPQEVVVPAGVTLRAWPDHVGIPHRTDADPGLATRLTAWSRDPSLDPSAILADATAADVPSLWHMLRRSAHVHRPTILARAEALAPLPTGVERSRALALDPSALATWRATMPW